MTDISGFWPLEPKWNEEIIKFYNDLTILISHPPYRRSGRTSILILLKMVSKAGISTLVTMLFKKLIKRRSGFKQSQEPATLSSTSLPFRSDADYIVTQPTMRVNQLIDI